MTYDPTDRRYLYCRDEPAVKRTDKVKRRVAAEKIKTTMGLLTHECHELYRVLHIHTNGLTKKEQRHVAKQLSAMEAARDELRRVWERANQSSPT